MKAMKTSSTMRTLEKTPKIDRRDFLRDSGLAGIGVTVVPVSALTVASSTVYAQSFIALGTDTGKTLIRMARDIFPHDKLAEKFYVHAVAPYDDAASKDPAQKALLTEGVATLNANAKKRFGKPYAEVPTEEERVKLLREIESSAFFQKVKGDLVTGLYNNKDLWPLFGYEGSSWQKGGYINRGFDDLNWL